MIEDETDPKKRLLLLSEAVGTNKSFISPRIQQEIQINDVEIVQHIVSLDINNYSTSEILKRLLPEATDIPSAFETVGHIAHMNLRDELIPQKSLIAQVILEKNPRIQTVINKTAQINNTFRVFPMEIIGTRSVCNGKDKSDKEYDETPGQGTIVVLKEEGLTFQFDYAKVYWNSRLHFEHRRLVNLILDSSSLKKDILIIDMFCGVGPFAIPAAKKGCTVYANDLNPDSIYWLRKNSKLNNISSDRLFIHQQDARQFVSDVFSSAALPLDFRHVHFIMNLPASSHTFLDVFPPLNVDGKLSEATVHCYCFCKENEDPLDFVEASIGSLINRSKAAIKRVRDVAPNKEMFCVSFKIDKLGYNLQTVNSDNFEARAIEKIIKTEQLLEFPAETGRPLENILKTEPPNEKRIKIDE